MTKEQWETKVRTYLESLNAELQENEQARKSYYGFNIWDSQFLMNPDILFIGINPGRGAGTRDYIVNLKPESRISYIDYLDEDDKYPYPLAKETIDLLEKIFLSKDKVKSFLEEKVVKTNLYYIKTDSESDIKKTVSYLGEEKWKEFFQKSCFFTIQLIKILKPKVVLFEGKSAYENIVEVCCEKSGTWKDGFGHFSSEEDEAEFIGYPRLFSNIQNKEAVSELLAKYISS